MAAIFGEGKIFLKIAKITFEVIHRIYNVRKGHISIYGKW